jgi:hypothetical protein
MFVVGTTTSVRSHKAVGSVVAPTKVLAVSLFHATQTKQV